eukprot:scaffold3201_cov116-Isochrysis_galbana.AAC.8
MCALYKHACLLAGCARPGLRVPAGRASAHVAARVYALNAYSLQLDYRGSPSSPSPITTTHTITTSPKAKSWTLDQAISNN